MGVWEMMMHSGTSFEISNSALYQIVFQFSNYLRRSTDIFIGRWRDLTLYIKLIKIFDKICCWKVKYEKSVNLIFIFYHFLVIVFTFKNRCSHILISYFTFSKIGKNQINIDSKIILFFNCIYLFLFFVRIFAISIRYMNSIPRNCVQW